jgi:acetolactate synthase I/II/III large subunit
MLKAYEVQHIFGVPGDTSMPFYDALYHARDEIAHIMARDERSAGFMADAYARLSGRPGITEAPSGGGATYVLPGVAEANGSSVPLIVLTSDVPLVDEGKGTLTAIDQRRLLEAATKSSLVVKRAQMLPDVIRRAFRIATSGRGGAVHVVLPEDVLVELAGADADAPTIYAEPACRQFPSYRTQAPTATLQQMLAALLAAKRPLLVAGGGAVLSGAWQEITQLAERLHVPVGTTINGKGSIVESHPWSVGVIGGNGGRPYANDLLAESDCIFYVGTKVNSLVTLNHTNPPSARVDRDLTVLQLNIDPSELGNNVPATIAACGDIKESLGALLRLLDHRLEQGKSGESGEILDIQRERTAADLAARASAFWAAAQERAASRSLPLTPQLVIETLWQRSPEDAVIVADPGTMTPFTAALFRTKRPGRSIVIPRAHGGLGYALPATVGAAYARPSERVVGLVGDGSFGMSATELATIGRLRLPITLIHFNNGTFGWIKMLQHLYYGQRYYGVDFQDEMDAAAVAQAFGVRGVRIEHPDQLAAELAQALDSTEPVFLDVPTRSELEEVPPVHAWQQATCGT